MVTGADADAETDADRKRFKIPVPYYIYDLNSGGSKGARGTRAPPPEVEILSISRSFCENLAKSYVGAPPWAVGAPSSGKSWIRHC